MRIDVVRRTIPEAHFMWEYGYFATISNRRWYIGPFRYPYPTSEVEARSDSEPLALAAFERRRVLLNA